MPVYKMEEGDLQWRFQKSRAKIQMFAGGFANGKTTSAVVKALQLARDYPGSNGLVARSTYPKLTNTIRKEFRKWCPKSWIERDIDSKQNLIQLTNGSIINFSHVVQSSRGGEDSTSNLLSATYDWIVFDQIEDPEVTHKDFLDLLGRLRGNTAYQGDDETMPSSGPRWFIIMCNPTRNWVYRELVKPLHDYKKGIPNEKLLADENGKPIIEIFEGSTYENKANLAKDYIETLEQTYRGQMASRYLRGGWEGYEGLVYPEYKQDVHLIDHDDLVEYYEMQCRLGAFDNIIEAYDHGIAKPACYGFGFTNQAGDVFILDGFYEKEQSIATSSKEIKRTRGLYGLGSADSDNFNDTDPDRLNILADPAIFRRSSGNSQTVGTTTSGLFREHGINMIRGNNDILNGIAKVQSYLYIDPLHRHPIYQHIVGAPRLYVSKKLTWWDTEITDYNWKKNAAGDEYEDIPQDKNDHAMDMTKYLLTNRPRVATFRQRQRPHELPSKYRQWREAATSNVDNSRKHRYA